MIIIVIPSKSSWLTFRSSAKQLYLELVVVEKDEEENLLSSFVVVVVAQVDVEEMTTMRCHSIFYMVK